MNSASNAVSLGRLKRRALSIGAVKTFDHAIQILLPVLLVRCLDTASFGEYRLLWLGVGTIMTFATLDMCRTLYFFVPRSEPRRKRLYIHQTMLYLAVAAVVCGFMVSPWNTLLPAPMRPLAQYGWLVPAFVALWVFAILLEGLPTVDERISWQAYATLSLSALRVLLIGLAAWFTGDLRIVLWLLLVVVLVKVGLLIYYVRRRHGLGAPWFEWAAFSEQFRHSAPLGLNSALHGFRGKADQWVAASLFTLSSFAAFSIAALVGRVVIVLRHSVMEAFLPSMSRLHAAGDVRGMLQMNSRGNVMVGKLFYPLLAFVFVFAHEIVTVVYTASYSEAAPVMRVYIVGMVAMVVEKDSLVMLLRQGTYAFRVTGFALVLSIALSWGAAHQVGLAGAAMGSVLAVYVDRVLVLRRVSRLTGIALRRLQDWRSLAVQFALAAAAGTLAWIIVDAFLAERGPLPRLAAGGAVFAVAYAAVHIRRFSAGRNPAAKDLSGSRART
jgi:O-antigen/teichoic acid export membrane protein